MTKNLANFLLLAAGCLIATALCGTAQAQKPTTLPEGTLDIALQYDTLSANSVTGNRFWMQGGSLQVHGLLHRGFGLVGDLSGEHTSNIHNTGVDLDMVTALVGPRYTWQPKKRSFSGYGQILVGEANGFNSTFPGPTGATSSAGNYAYQLGGGVDYRVSRSWSIRIAHLDWLRTQLSNSTTQTQNNLRIGAGVVLHYR
jgi:opacity protein-like surface antigen